MLKLCREKRYIQGDLFSKIEIIQEHGGKAISKAEAMGWPLKGGVELVAVLQNASFDAALWIRDHDDHRRVMTNDDGRHVLFYAVRRLAFDEALHGK